MTRRSAHHTSFVLERRFAASPARVFRAWSDPQAKRRWSDCHADVGTSEYCMDFRPGGRELHRATLPDGREQIVDKIFLEIAPDARVIFAYSLAVAGRTLSTSQVTVELDAEPNGRYVAATHRATRLSRRP